jgi:hypothetical protein
MIFGERQRKQVDSLMGFLAIAGVLFLCLLIVAQNRRNYALYVEAQSRTPDLQKMKELIARGANVNARIHAHMDGGWTPLHTAVDNSRYRNPDKTKAVVKLLLDEGADVNAVDPNEYTALMLAAREANVDVVRLLIKAGADVNIRRGNDTALTIVQEWSHTWGKPKHPAYVETIRLLKAAKAKEQLQVR